MEREKKRAELMEVGSAHWNTELVEHHTWEYVSLLPSDSPLRIGWEPNDLQHHASRGPNLHLDLF